MKKILTYILVQAAALLLMCSCEDFRDNYMVEDTIYLRSESGDLIQNHSIYDALFRFGVIKAGKGRTAATVELGIAPADSVLIYNQRHKTDYIPLSKSLYNADAIDGKVISFAAKDANAKVEVEWDPQTMVNKMLAEKDNFVIPVYIKNASLKVSDSKYMLLIRPVLSVVSVTAADNYFSCRSGAKTTGKVGLRLDNAIPGHDVKIKLAYAPKAVTANGINHVAAPSGAVRLVSEDVVIPAGSQEVSAELVMDMAAVADNVTHLAGEITITGAEVVIKDARNIDFIPIQDGKMTVRIAKTKN